MTFRDVLDELKIRTAQWIGPNDEYKISRDSSEYVVEDVGNSTKLLRLPDNTPLEQTLEQGGVAELVIGNLLNFDPAAIIVDTHANRPAAGTADRVFVATDERYVARDTGSQWDIMGATAASLAEGGEDPLNVEDLVTSSTDTSQFFTPDGNGGIQLSAQPLDTLSASETDDGSDVTEHEVENASSDTDLVNLTSTSGILLGGVFVDKQGTGSGGPTATYTVDGGSTWTVQAVRIKNQDFDFGFLPPVEFSSSLTITLNVQSAISGHAVHKS